MRDKRFRETFVDEMTAFDNITNTQVRPRSQRVSLTHRHVTVGGHWQDEVMLRRAYALLLRRMHQQRREEMAEEERTIEGLRQNAEQRLRTMNNLCARSPEICVPNTLSIIFLHFVIAQVQGANRDA
jgi:hypothetical protein